MVVSAGPTTANAARMLTYRPLPGQEAKTVTITMKILSRPSGEGTDYASMPVLASKDITLTVQPLTQEELDTAAAFMKLVCTEDVYWEGIRNANEQNGNNAVELLVIESALIAGFSKILAEKLIRLCGADAEDVLAAEQTPPQP